MCNLTQFTARKKKQWNPGSVFLPWEKKFKAGAFLKKTSGFTVEASPGRSESNYCKNIFYTNPYKPYKHRGPAN